MKTLGYADRANPARVVHCYGIGSQTGRDPEPGRGYHKRINDAREDIRGLGNVDLYLVYGRKMRKIGRRGF